MTSDDLSDKFEDCGRNKLYFYVDCAIDYVLEVGSYERLATTGIIFCGIFTD